jgi:MFS family permease
MRFRNVGILGVAMALGLCGVPMLLLMGGIVGGRLAPAPAWATLPITVMVVGTALATLPAALLMRRIGRKRGFLVGTTLALAGALLIVYAIAAESFVLFCIGALGIGANMSFVLQYRFAASESVDKAYVGKAVSFVLLGGVVAGYLGPQIAKLSKDWLSYGEYAATFAILAALQILAVALLLLLKDVAVGSGNATGDERSLRAVAVQPAYLVALWTGVVAYGVMGFVMTATPISMHVMDQFSVGDTATVIQIHVMAMYLPSVFSGFLVDRLGALRLKLLGVLCMGASAVPAMLGHGLANYLVGLTLLGIGWNFLFVGATVLLTHSYRPSERFKAQGFNDLFVFGALAVVTLMAGWVITRASWGQLNLIGLPLLAITLVVILSLRRSAAA